MVAVLVVIAIILAVGLAFYATYGGLKVYKERILQRLAGVDARLRARHKAVNTFIDSAQSVMVNDEAIIFAVRKLIIEINKLPARWNNNKDRFRLENELDIKLNTLFTAAMKYPEIKSNVYLNKYLQEFINIQTMLQPCVVEYNNTLRAFKGLINSPIGQILAPQINIKCEFVEYYIPEN